MKWHAAAVAAVLAVGMGMRLFGAWCFRTSGSADHGIVCLMAKHMAEGRDFPVFYYGQPYMGSFEPAVSALFCKALGVSGFAVNLGTALMGILILPVVYAWGRAAGGRAAGLAALAFCAIGPPDWFQFMSWGYGGYATLVLTGSLVVALAVRPDAKARFSKCACFGAGAFAIGLAAGLGWWTSQLIVPAVAAAAAVVAARRRTRHGAAGMLGFLLGSAPFWWWNARHGWATFRHFAAAVGAYPVTASLRAFVVEGLYPLIGASPLAAILLLGLAALALPGLLSSRGLAAAFLLFALSAGFFCVGGARYAAVPAVRYLLPLYPVLAVVAGAGTARLVRLLPRGIGWAPLVVLVALHVPPLRGYLWWGRDTTLAVRTAGFGDFLRSNAVEAVYGPYATRGPNHSLNFLLREEFCFTSPEGERYPPYAAFAERSERIGVLNNHGFFPDFLASAGGSADVGGPRGYQVHFNLAVPQDPLEEVPPERWRSFPAPVADGNLATSWFDPRGGDGPAEFVLRFHEEEEVALVRFVSRARRYPEAWQVDVIGAFEQWEPVTAEMIVTPWFWSGPRPYWGEPFYRVECRIEPRWTSGVRIRVRPARCEISELMIYSTAPSTPSSEESLSSLLLGDKTKPLYCDRWLAAKLGVECRDGLVPPGARLVVEPENVALCRRVTGMEPATNFGPWSVFDVPVATSLWWSGFACFRRSAECRMPGDPEIPAAIRFASGVELIGVSLSTNRLAPGSLLGVTYFWRCPPGLDPDRFAAFVHFRDAEGIVFQGDHVLLEHVDTTVTPRPDVFVEETVVEVPADARPGRLSIVAGLYDRADPKRRLAPRTDLPSRRRAVTLPASIGVALP